jgi:hypothetical protein
MWFVFRPLEAAGAGAACLAGLAMLLWIGKLLGLQ